MIQGADLYLALRAATLNQRNLETLRKTIPSNAVIQYVKI